MKLELNKDAVSHGLFPVRVCFVKKKNQKQCKTTGSQSAATSGIQISPGDVPLPASFANKPMSSSSLECVILVTTVQATS